MSRIINIPCFVDWDGKLGLLESEQIQGFYLNRFFFIKDVPKGAMRANHACMNANLVLIAINGKVTVSVEAERLEEYCLDTDIKALYVPEASWIKAYDFSEDAILICFSDKQYDKCVYLNDYEEYLKKTGKHN